MIQQQTHILREKIEKDMIDTTRKALIQLDASNPTTIWPNHWKDLVHDENGGYDMFGAEPKTADLH